MRVVIKNPGFAPFEAIIPNSLEAMQSIVGGYIEHVAVDDGLHVICNETGILDNLTRNTAVFIHGNPMAMFGPIIFCDVSGEDFASLDIDGVAAAIKMCEDGSGWTGVDISEVV